MEQITREEMIELLKDGELLAEVTGNIDLAKRYGAAIATLQAAEPVAWQFYQDGEWHNGDDSIKGHRENTEAADIPARDLFTLPCPPTISCQLYGHEVKGCGECSPPANAVDDNELAELMTKTILFEDCGNTSDWQDNINLGEAVVKALKKHGAKVQQHGSVGCEKHQPISTPHCPVCLVEERDSWRRTAEQLEMEKTDPAKAQVPEGWIVHAKVNHAADVPGQRIIGYRVTIPDPDTTPLSKALDQLPPIHEQSAREHEGWRLAPIEPTHAMIQAGRDAPLAGPDDEDAPEDYRIVYKAMLTASPAPGRIGDGNKMDSPGEYVHLPVEPNPEHIAAIEWQIGPEGRTAGTAAGIYKAIVEAQRQQEDAEH